MVGFLCPLAATAAIADPCTRACVDIEAFFPAGTFMPGQVVELDVMRTRASQKSRVIEAISGEAERGCQAVDRRGTVRAPHVLWVRRLSLRELQGSVAGSLTMLQGGPYRVAAIRASRRVTPSGTRIR